MTAFRLDNHLPADFLADSLRSDVYHGLSGQPKALPPKWFYDERGSQLFAQITHLPEYYLTRAEREILIAHADHIAERTQAHTIVELGAGTADKTRILLTALRAQSTLRRFIPVDVSVGVLVDSCEALMEEYPALEVHAVMADFESQLGLLPEGGPRLTAFLGGTIGNLQPMTRLRFLDEVRRSMEADDWLLLGVDLVKDEALLSAAYNDTQGITAEFNRNVLHVINRELKADFDPLSFDHVARWDAEHECIDMRLRSHRTQEVRVAGLDMVVSFTEGEEMRTEVSAKFRRERLEAELAGTGFGVREWWTDSAGLFAMSLAQAV